MEILLSIVVLWGICAALGVFSGKSGSTTGASAQGSMGPFTLRVRDSRKNAGEDNELLVKEVEGRGLLPIDRPVNAAFVSSVFDKTSGELLPVVSAVEAFQEPDNVVFQHSIDLGRVSPNQGFGDFSRIGAVIPDILIPPYSGWRTLTVVARLIDVDNPPDITHGRHEPDHSGLLWAAQRDFKWNFHEVGYKEEAENRDEAIALIVQVGVAVAMADGSMADAEGACIKRWIEKTIDPFDGPKREELKTECNTALKNAYQQARDGEFSIGSVTDQLKRVADTASKYEAIELAYDVLSADGVADQNELKTVKIIAEHLELSMESVSQMRDKTLLRLKSDLDGQADIEDMLGIDPEWDAEKIQRHLRSEFRKWNDRLNNLPEGSQRDNAQRMLDLIAKARKKYG